MSQIHDVAARMKLESPIMAATPVEMRNDALARIGEALRAHADELNRTAVNTVNSCAILFISLNDTLIKY